MERNVSGREVWIIIITTADDLTLRAARGFSGFVVDVAAAVIARIGRHAQRYVKISNEPEIRHHWLFHISNSVQPPAV